MSRVAIASSNRFRQAAAQGNDCNLLKAIYAGAYIDHLDDDRQTAAWSVAHRGVHRCLAILLERGADVDVTDTASWTPLHIAAGQGHLRCLRLLLKMGADPDRQTGQMGTSLHIAARNGHRQCAIALMDAGASRCIPVERSNGKEGKRPAEAAEYEGHLRTAYAIRTFIPGRSRMLRQMTQWRRAVEAERDASMVFRAASEGRPMELAKRLRLGKLAGGLQIQGPISEDESGNSRMVLPLEAARMQGHADCVRLLRRAGARGL